MHVNGLGHQNESANKPMRRMRKLSLTAEGFCDERVLALLATAIGEGGTIKIKLAEQDKFSCFEYRKEKDETHER